MKKRIYNQTSLFGPLYAYLVIISPPEHVKNDIVKIKREMSRIIDLGDKNMHSIPHITLVDKLTDDVYFTETITKLIEDEKPFTIKVSGWNLFDHGHSLTVYLTIIFPHPIVNMMQLVKSTSKTPHLSIAKKISYDDFKKLVPFLNSLNFSAEWVCSEVLVLRKLMSEKHLGFREVFPVTLKN